MLTGQCRRRLGKPYSKDQDTLPRLPRNGFQSNGDFPQIESVNHPDSCQPTLAPDSDPITFGTELFGCCAKDSPWRSMYGSGCYFFLAGT